MGNYVAIGFGAYIALSLTLFFFPNIIHKKRKHECELIDEALHSPSNKVVLIAHRGGI